MSKGLLLKNVRNAAKNIISYKNLGCIAYSINLVLITSLKLIRSLIEKLLILVGHFRQSIKATNILNKEQKNKERNFEPKELRMEVKIKF